MSDPVARLNAALEGRYAIERELPGADRGTYLSDARLPLHCLPASRTAG